MVVQRQSAAPAETPPSAPALLSVREAAAWFDGHKRPGQGRTTKHTVYRRIKRGNRFGVRLEATLSGGDEYLITVAALERFVRETDAAAMPPPADAPASVGRSETQALADRLAARQRLRAEGVYGKQARTQTRR